MSQKVLITGGSGFIGSNLVNFLVKRKYKIINLDKLKNKKAKDSDLFQSNHNDCGSVNKIILTIAIAILDINNLV